MPTELDLTGRRFGRLVVLQRAERVKYGRWQWSWLCVCDCAAEVTVPQNRLPHRPSIPPRARVEACPDCRAHPCMVCDTPIPPPSTANTCSDDCAAVAKRSRWRADYRRAAETPGYLEARSETARATRAALTDEQRTAKDRATYQRKIELRGRDTLNTAARGYHEQRMAADPEYRETKRAAAATYRAEHLTEVRLQDRNQARSKRALKAAKEIGAAAHDLERRIAGDR